MLVSCRYSLPVLKIRTDHYVTTDTLGSQLLKQDSKVYSYFCISRYGVVGECWKDRYYDSTGKLTAIHVSKLSAMVCDGDVMHHHKEKQFDAKGKLLRVTRTRFKENGWGSNTRSFSKCIDYSSGRRVVSIGQ